MLKRMSQIAVGAALLALPIGLAGSAAAVSASAGTTAATSTSRAALIRNCINVPNGDVGRGSTGNYVREVQCLLNNAVRASTYHTISVDGQFGADTEGKAIKFQQCVNARGGNLRVDGRVGPLTAVPLEDWAASDNWIC